MPTVPSSRFAGTAFLPQGNVRLRLLLALALTLFGISLAALIALLYTFPIRYDSFFYGLDPLGMQQFQAHLGLGWIPRLHFRSYSRFFRLFLILMWAGYGATLLACLRGARLAGKPLAVVAALVGLLIALFAPPLLSTDSYAYASHGRIFVLYGHNPYVWLPSGLAAVHDPELKFLRWNLPTIYGPLWTWIEIAVAALLRPYGLWPEVIAFKLIGAGALLATALAGRALAARFSRGRENVTFLAIALNPLFLLEGPGSGHNDFVLVSTLLFGALFYFDKKYIAAALLLGLSVAIKPITLALLPWVLLDYIRGRSWRQAVTGAAVALVLVTLPMALFFVPFWDGPATLAAMQLRTNYEQNPAALARLLQVHAWLLAHGVGPALASGGVLLYRNWLLLGVYAALTVCVWKLRQADRWLMAWAIFSAALMFLWLKPAFPWYIVWFWPICLLRWDRWHLSLSAACLGLSFVLVCNYAMLSFHGDPTVHHWIPMNSLPASVSPTPRNPQLQTQIPRYTTRSASNL